MRGVRNGVPLGVNVLVAGDRVIVGHVSLVRACGLVIPAAEGVSHARIGGRRGPCAVVGGISRGVLGGALIIIMVCNGVGVGFPLGVEIDHHAAEGIVPNAVLGAVGIRNDRADGDAAGHPGAALAAFAGPALEGIAGLCEGVGCQRERRAEVDGIVRGRRRAGAAVAVIDHAVDLRDPAGVNGDVFGQNDRIVRAAHAGRRIKAGIGIPAFERVTGLGGRVKRGQVFVPDRVELCRGALRACKVADRLVRFVVRARAVDGAAARARAPAEEGAGRILVRKAVAVRVVDVVDLIGPREAVGVDLGILIVDHAGLVRGVARGAAVAVEVDGIGDGGPNSLEFHVAPLARRHVQVRGIEALGGKPVAGRRFHVPPDKGVAGLRGRGQGHGLGDIVAGARKRIAAVGIIADGVGDGRPVCHQRHVGRGGIGRSHLRARNGTDVPALELIAVARRRGQGLRGGGSIPMRIERIGSGRGEVRNSRPIRISNAAVLTGRPAVERVAGGDFGGRHRAAVRIKRDHVGAAVAVAPERLRNVIGEALRIRVAICDGGVAVAVEFDRIGVRGPLGVQRYVRGISRIQVVRGTEAAVRVDILRAAAVFFAVIAAEGVAGLRRDRDARDRSRRSRVGIITGNRVLIIHVPGAGSRGGLIVESDVNHVLGPLGIERGVRIHVTVKIVHEVAGSVHILRVGTVRAGIIAAEGVTGSGRHGHGRDCRVVRRIGEIRVRIVGVIELIPIGSAALMVQRDLDIVRRPHTVNHVGRGGSRRAVGVGIAADRAVRRSSLKRPMVERVAVARAGSEHVGRAGVSLTRVHKFVREGRAVFILPYGDLGRVARPHRVERDCGVGRGGKVARQSRAAAPRFGGGSAALTPAEEVPAFSRERVCSQRQVGIIGLRLRSHRTRAAVAVVLDRIGDGSPLGVELNIRGGRIAPIAISNLRSTGGCRIPSLQSIPGFFGIRQRYTGGIPLRVERHVADAGNTGLICIGVSPVAVGSGIPMLKGICCLRGRCGIAARRFMIIIRNRIFPRESIRGQVRRDPVRDRLRVHAPARMAITLKSNGIRGQDELEFCISVNGRCVCCVCSRIVICGG